MTYQALALLGEDGVLDIRWADPDSEHPAALTVVAFGDLLRDAAPYLPDADAATALVANMTVQGAFEPWAYTVITASRQGEITFTASDQKAWYQALGAGETAAATQPSAPVPPPAASGASDPSLASPTVPTSAASPASAASAASGVDVAEIPAVPRRSFLDQQAAEEPARQGWRGRLTRLGLRVRPGSAERSERADVLAVSQHWPGPRTIAIVNGKGGAGKTPTTILLSAVLARYGGAGVLAVDLNQTRGTLGWRTEQGSHTATVLDLLPETDRLLGTGAQAADLARFVHHQTSDRYDVLRSQPLELAASQRLTTDDVDALHAVASKYYRLILIDSGNDESDAVWQRMIDHTTQVVVATTPRDDHAEAGALLLEALERRNPASAALAGQAVVIVSRADPSAKPADLRRIIDGYHGLARDVVAIPHDPAMVGGRLLYSALRPATQRAWLAAAAAVARGL